MVAHSAPHADFNCVFIVIMKLEIDAVGTTSLSLHERSNVFDCLIGRACDTRLPKDGLLFAVVVVDTRTDCY